MTPDPTCRNFPTPFFLLPAKVTESQNIGEHPNLSALWDTMTLSWASTQESWALIRDETTDEWYDFSEQDSLHKSVLERSTKNGELHFERNNETENYSQRNEQEN